MPPRPVCREAPRWSFPLILSPDTGPQSTAPSFHPPHLLARGTAWGLGPAPETALTRPGFLFKHRELPGSHGQGEMDCFPGHNPKSHHPVSTAFLGGSSSSRHGCPGRALTRMVQPGPRVHLHVPEQAQASRAAEAEGGEGVSPDKGVSMVRGAL